VGRKEGKEARAIAVGGMSHLRTRAGSRRRWKTLTKKEIEGGGGKGLPKTEDRSCFRG